MYDLAKEKFFDERALRNKSIRDKSLIRILKSTAIMVSGISTIFLPGNLEDLSERKKMLLQEKQTGNKTE